MGSSIIILRTTQGTFEQLNIRVYINIPVTDNLSVINRPKAYFTKWCRITEFTRVFLHHQLLLILLSDKKQKRLVASGVGGNPIVSSLFSETRPMCMNMSWHDVTNGNSEIHPHGQEYDSTS